MSGVRSLVALSLVATSACSLFIGDDAASGDSDGAPSGEAKIVFLTSMAVLGDIEQESPDSDVGIDVADDICDMLAIGAGLEGQFSAWLSTELLVASARLPDGVFWTLVDGETLVFSRKSAIAAGPQVAIDHDETGERVSAQPVWTGTTAGGVLTADHCNNWESGMGGGGVVLFAGHGISNATDGTWTEMSTARCSERARLYCFEI